MLMLAVVLPWPFGFSQSTFVKVIDQVSFRFSVYMIYNLENAGASHSGCDVRGKCDISVEMMSICNLDMYINEMISYKHGNNARKAHWLDWMLCELCNILTFAIFLCSFLAKPLQLWVKLKTKNCCMSPACHRKIHSDGVKYLIICVSMQLTGGSTDCVLWVCWHVHTHVNARRNVNKSSFLWEVLTRSWGSDSERTERKERNFFFFTGINPREEFIDCVCTFLFVLMSRFSLKRPLPPSD